MMFADSIWIHAPPSQVWRYVASLDCWPRFYTQGGKGKCKQVSPEGGVVGSIYDMEFATPSSTIVCHYEIVDLRPGRTNLQRLKNLVEGT